MNQYDPAAGEGYWQPEALALRNSYRGRCNIVRVNCYGRPVKARGLAHRADQRPPPPAPRAVRSGIEERISHKSAQRRPPVVPDGMRVPRGTTTPRHSPTNPAVGRPVEQHRPSYSDGAASRNPASATSGGGAGGGPGAAGRVNSLVRIHHSNSSLSFPARVACPARKAAVTFKNSTRAQEHS